MNTKQLENAIFRKLEKIGTYLCFEVMMPSVYNIGIPNERVDLLSYDTKGNWNFYELKITKQDFYSKNAHTFLGHLNYYVIPIELLEVIKKDIPAHVGVYVAKYHEHYKYYYCECIKKAKRQELKVDDEKLMFAFMQSLSREHGKYRRLLGY